MDAETFARALHAALAAEGLVVDDRHGDLKCVRIAGVTDLTAVARRMRATPVRARIAAPCP
ncbi:hypothetical protein [Caulobacter sp. 17J80-11]|uniref:hypothetical protein n=1 Tax=Caulobacter sp. 17J80-11 TaxID=2763502 RepID=UPI001653C646|nr:hypothetical protein [Caulobacter sp. 17J80-11]MBC6981271.1 hypothetical protein [Caulobacter sp. 17J80-11]